MASSRTLALSVSAALVLSEITVVAAAPPAHAVGGYQILFLAADTASTTAHTTYSAGRTSGRPIVGDPEGDGIDTVAVRRGIRMYFRGAPAAW